MKCLFCICQRIDCKVLYSLIYKMHHLYFERTGLMQGLDVSLSSHFCINLFPNDNTERKWCFFIQCYCMCSIFAKAWFGITWFGWSLMRFTFGKGCSTESMLYEAMRVQMIRLYPQIRQLYGIKSKAAISLTFDSHC